MPKKNEVEVKQEIMNALVKVSAEISTDRKKIVPDEFHIAFQHLYKPNNIRGSDS